jgi:hypothetical protein
LKKENYLGLKYLSSENEIAQVLQGALSDKFITLAEAEYVQKKEGFIAFLGLILSSRNFLNIDKVFSEITMSEVPEVLKNRGSESIPIVGRSVEEVRFNINNV